MGRIPETGSDSRPEGAVQAETQQAGNLKNLRRDREVRDKKPTAAGVEGVLMGLFSLRVLRKAL